MALVRTEARLVTRACSRHEKTEQCLRRRSAVIRRERFAANARRTLDILMSLT